MQKSIGYGAAEMLVPYDGSKSDGSSAGKAILQAIEEAGVAQ